jgi:hypothetical protein
MPRKLKSTIVILVMLLAGVFLAACSSGNQAPPTNESSTAPSSPTPPPKVGFEKDLDYVRKGQYTYVWVFARKDGKPLDKDDGAFLRKNAPQVVDWVTSEEGKKVIAGTNFDLALGNLELIKKRFIAEDYSNK